MGDSKFIEILEKLEKIHKDFPSMRFGEVIQVALDQGLNLHNVNLYDRSSKQILSKLEEYYELLKFKREKNNVN
jgi:hypothetical protein